MSPKKQNQFKLKDFLGVDPEHIVRLEKYGIKTCGQTGEKRTILASLAGIPVEIVLELVKLSDLTRLPEVKSIRARLNYAPGVDSVEKMAACEPQAPLWLTADFVGTTGFEGIPPLLKEVSSTIDNARKLPKLVEW